MKEKLIRFKRIPGGKKITPIHHSSSRLLEAHKRTGQTTEGLSIRKSTASPPPSHHQERRTRLPRLTYEIRQQNGQEEGGGDGGQGGAFPAAVLGGLLQLEGLPGEGVPGQQAGRGCVNGS